MRGCVSLLLVIVGCASAPQAPDAPAQPPREPPATAGARVPGACSIRTEGFSGVTTTAFTYADGQRTRAVQQGPSGSVQTLWTYDPRGRRAKQVVIDGQSIRTHTFAYEHGVLVREDVHEGASVLVERHVREYEGGKLVARSLARRVDAALVEVDRHALHYDAAGRFVYELRTLTLPERPAQVHSVTVEVDEDGRVVARRIDEGMDGTADRVSLFAFDADGHLTTVTAMRDDRVETVSRHRYGPQGRLVQTEIEDGAGKTVGTTTYDYSCWT